MNKIIWTVSGNGRTQQTSRQTAAGLLVANRCAKSLPRLGKPGKWSLSIAIKGVVELETSGTAAECDAIVAGY